jgi:hypothetical protein
MRYALMILLAWLATPATLSAQGRVNANETAAMVLGADLPFDHLAAASELFRGLPEEQNSDQVWRALYRIRTMFDGAAAEEYAHMAFLLSVDHPRIFYDRFLLQAHPRRGD